MAVIARGELEQSPLADLHAIASELGIEGFRRMRKEELIDTILRAQGGDGAAEETPDEESEDVPEPRPEERRSRQTRRASREKREEREEREEREPEPED